jgi:hypothetical protein
VALSEIHLGDAMTMTDHAIDAISLVPRERGCGHNETAQANDKIIDVDVFVAGQKRGTWRWSTFSNKYSMHLELLNRDGSMNWALPFGTGGSCDADRLKSATAELLMKGQLPQKRDYTERRVIHFLIDYRYAIVAAPIAIGLVYWIFIR